MHILEYTNKYAYKLLWKPQISMNICIYEYVVVSGVIVEFLYIESKYTDHIARHIHTYIYTSIHMYILPFSFWNLKFKSKLQTKVNLTLVWLYKYHANKMCVHAFYICTYTSIHVQVLWKILITFQSHRLCVYYLMVCNTRNINLISVSTLFWPIRKFEIREQLNLCTKFIAWP